MRFSIPLVLYSASLAMTGVAGKLFWEASPALGGAAVHGFSVRGDRDARAVVARGHGQMPADLRYGYDDGDWWSLFKFVNWTGAVPKDDVGGGPGSVPPPVPPAETPLHEIIELIHLMFDGACSSDVVDETHVTVRYLPEANVEVPEEARAEVQEVVHRIEPGEALWKPYDHIFLVRVSDDCESAWFARRRPGDEPGSTPVEEEVVKCTLGLGPVLSALLLSDRRIVRAGSPTTGDRDNLRAESNGAWIDVQETRLIDGRYHIGRDDTEMFRAGGGDLMERIHVMPYSGEWGGGSVRGLRVLDIDSHVARRYGIGRNDVILALNGKPVRSQAEALSIGRKLHDRGVRTFVVTLLTGGRTEERIYQARQD